MRILINAARAAMLVLTLLPTGAIADGDPPARPVPAIQDCDVEPTFQQPSSPPNELLSAAVRIEGKAQVAQKRCCKICRKGKACGNSCIRRDYTCHQPPGCACNGY